MAERRRSLTTRLAAWIALVFALSLVIFGGVVFAVATREERFESERALPESSAEIVADVQAEELLALAAAAPVGLLLSVGGAIWVARRTMAPVRDLARAATEITTERLDRRLPVPRGHHELRELALALNGLLGRVEQGFVEQGAFAADAAHQLRTPLAAVAVELGVALRRTRTAEDWAATAGSALDDVRRLSRLVDALLALRRAQLAPLDHTATSDLGVVVDDVADRAAGAARAAGVTLGLPEELPARRVAGKPDELAIALGNVVANALRAAPRGGSVRLAVDDAGGAVTLHVDDDGPGVAPGDEERIFAPFARGRDAEADDGFGLGLAIARRIVEGAGGSLTCAGAPGGGARFTFRLRAG